MVTKLADWRCTTAGFCLVLAEKKRSQFDEINKQLSNPKLKAHQKANLTTKMW